MRTELRTSSGIKHCPDWKFPCLGRHMSRPLIVGFTAPGHGTVVFTLGDHPLLFHFSTEWKMDEFYPVPESDEIVLCNSMLPSAGVQIKTTAA